MALPLTAVLVLGAGPVEMGVMRAAGSAPFLLFGLLAGVFVDRSRRRHIMISTDIWRGLLIGSIPVSALLGMLRIEQLYVVAFLVGILTVWFDVAYLSILPSLIKRDTLIKANSRLETSRSLAQVSGPGIAGVLVQVVSAPITVFLDSVSFFLSAALLGLMRASDQAPSRTTEDKRLLADMLEGVRVVFGNPILRPIVGCSSTLGLFGGMVQAAYVLYVTRDLGLQPVTVGLIFSAGSLGSVVGALAAGRLALLFGLGRTMIVAALLNGVGTLLIPMADSLPSTAVVWLVIAQVVTWMAFPVYLISQTSLRQGITPDRLQGRANATFRFIAWGMMPLGSLVGGGIGALVDVKAALWTAGVGMQLAMFWLLLSPVRSLRGQPVVG